MKKIAAYVIIVLLNILIYFLLNFLVQYSMLLYYGSGAGGLGLGLTFFRPFIDIINLIILYIIYKKQSLVKNRLFFISIALVLQYAYFEFYFSYIFR